MSWMKLWCRTMWWSGDKGTEVREGSGFQANFFWGGVLLKTKLKDYIIDFVEFLSGLGGSWDQILDVTRHFLTQRQLTLSIS